jgi:SAM-dependent methyltransferase
LKFTGERYTPSEQGEIRLEHYHRYALALSLAKSKMVLDVACGEGYGSALLSETASEVVGLDISQEAVAHASKVYQGRANLQFLQKSAFDTGLPDDSFDLVVSFETIEHLLEQGQMLTELRRVLKPDGLLLISSPNGQRLAMGTVVQPLTGHCSEFKAFSDDGDVVRAHTGKLAEPVYFVALCSALQGDLPSLGASVFFPDSLDLVKHYTGFAKWAKKQDIEIDIRDKNVRNYKSEVEKLSHQREQLRTEILRAEAQLELLKDLFRNQLGGESL